MGNDGITRRNFLGGAARLAAGATVIGSSQFSGCNPSTTTALNTGPPEHPEMNYRILGKTGLWISEISLGGHWRGRNGERYWNEFAEEVVPADVVANRSAVIDECLEKGINYLDIVTAAESLAYGAALKDRREKMIIGADNHMLGPRRQENISVEKQIYNVEECLRQLGTDYLDIWRVQADMLGRNTDDEVQVCVEAFLKLKEQGKVLFFGVSCHNRPWLEHVIETFAEVSMVIFPYTAQSATQEIDPGHGADQSTSIFSLLKEKNIGAICIKPFAGGSLFRVQDTPFDAEEQGNTEDHDLAQLTLAYVLLNQNITATVPGMTTVSEVQNNTSASARALELTQSAEARQHLNRAATRMVAALPEDYRWLEEWAVV